jgi:uncharacterized protein YjiS (DUF1127 family)
MHRRKKEEEGIMSSAGWTRPNAAAAPAADAGRRLSAVVVGVGALIARGWRAYWGWRMKRTTVLILQSLDRRTLRDIGIDASEIESLVCSMGRDRRYRRDAGWPWRSGGV